RGERKLSCEALAKQDLKTSEDSACAKVRIPVLVAWPSTILYQEMAENGPAQCILDLKCRGDDLATVKTTTLGRLLSPFLFGAVLLTCAAKAPDLEPVVPLGDNTYSVVREASNTFMRDIEK